MKIVNQFRALHDVGLISNTYWYADQKYASKMFEECVNNNRDDEILLEGLRRYAFTFIDALQTVPVDELPEWRAFLRDNFNVCDEFDRQCGTERLSSMFTKALGLAGMLQTGETEMNEQKPRKRVSNVDQNN